MTELELDLYYHDKFIHHMSSQYLKRQQRKGPKNLILAKGNNSCKSESNVTKLKLDLLYVMTNSHTKFQVNIAKDNREKFGKLKCDRLTDRLTD